LTFAERGWVGDQPPQRMLMPDTGSHRARLEIRAWLRLVLPHTAALRQSRMRLFALPLAMQAGLVL